MRARLSAALRGAAGRKITAARPVAGGARSPLPRAPRRAPARLSTEVTCPLASRAPPPLRPLAPLRDDHDGLDNVPALLQARFFSPRAAPPRSVRSDGARFRAQQGRRSQSRSDNEPREGNLRAHATRGYQRTLQYA